MNISDEFSENQSIYRLRWVGYVLLLLFLVDTLSILPPVVGFSNTWALQTVGALVEHVIVPILGMGFVFFGEFYDRHKLEVLGLKLLSWLCLMLAIVYLLLLVPLVGNTLLINTQLSQMPQPLAELQKIEERVNQSSPEELDQLANRLTGAGIAVNKDDPEAVKKQVLNQIQEARPKIEAQLLATHKQTQQQRSFKQTELFRNSIRWGIGTILASVLFFLIWQGTRWARLT